MVGQFAGMCFWCLWVFSLLVSLVGWVLNRETGRLAGGKLEGKAG